MHTTIKIINKAVIVAILAILAGIVTKFIQRAVGGAGPAQQKIDKIARATTTGSFRNVSSGY